MAEVEEASSRIRLHTSTGRQSMSAASVAAGQLETEGWLPRKGSPLFQGNGLVSRHFFRRLTTGHSLGQNQLVRFAA